MKQGRWLLVGVAVWAAVLVGAAIWSVRYDPPTAREQVTTAAAQSTVDRTVAQVDALAAGAQTVVAIGPYEKVGGCRVTAARSGARYQRVAVVYTPVGTEEELLDRIARGLPAEYRARVRGARLTADAGGFVALTGEVRAPGQVRFAADTGCRPEGEPVTSQGSAPDGGSRQPVEALLATLGTQAEEWRAHRVPCPVGSPLWTVEAVAGGAPESLDAALKTPVGDAAVVALPELYAFRSGPVGLAVRTEDGRLVVTATTDCAQ